jgi:predicted  nucleic acid-binding Zn-ribbon protein
MRAFVVIMLFLAVAVAATGYALGWFQFSTSLAEQKRDLTVTVDRDKVKADRDAVTAASDDAGQKDRTHFLQRAESRFKALESRVTELQDKAKHGRAVTKDKINLAIDDLARKTAAARVELRELNTANDERWDALKTRVGTSLHALEDACEQAFSRFMNEDARGGRDDSVVAVLGSSALKRLHSE